MRWSLMGHCERAGRRFPRYSLMGIIYARRIVTSGVKNLSYPIATHNAY